MATINSDTRGLFVELEKDYRFFNYSTIKQISYLTINPGCFRGSHYHLETHEAFILLEGQCDLVVSGKNHNACYYKKMTLFGTYDIIPGEQHTLISKNGAKILVLSSKIFDPQNPDTFTYE